LKAARSAAFSIEVCGEERAVALVETSAIRSRGGFVAIRCPDARGTPDNPTIPMLFAIRRAVAEEHDLQLYDVALVSPGIIPRTSSGKTRRHACRVMYLEKLKGNALQARQLDDETADDCP